MDSRAAHSRTVAIVAALFLTAVSARAEAREFRAADTQSEDYPTVQALRHMGGLIAELSGGRLQIRGFHSRQLGEEKEVQPLHARDVEGPRDRMNSQGGVS